MRYRRHSNARLLQLSCLNELPVGQYFSMHPHFLSYAYLVLDEQNFRSVAYEPPSGSRVRRAIAMSSEFSNAHGLQSVTFSIPVDRENLQKRTRRNLLGWKRKTIEGRTWAQAEMPHLEENKIVLSDSRRDFPGQPISHVSLKLNLREVQVAYEHLNAELIGSYIQEDSAPGATTFDRLKGRAQGTAGSETSPTLGSLSLSKRTSRLPRPSPPSPGPLTIRILLYVIPIGYVCKSPKKTAFTPPNSNGATRARPESVPAPG